MKKANKMIAMIIALASLAPTGLQAAAYEANIKPESPAVIQEVEDDSESFGDFENLTDEEIKELNGIYDRFEAIDEEVASGVEDIDSLTDEEYEKLYEKYADELEKLEARCEELETKAGIFDEDFYDDFEEVDYGNLTDEEIEELNGIYDRFEAIDEEVASGVEDIDSLTDEEYEKLYEKYADELEKLEARCEELETKAGIFDEDFYYDFDEDF
ncbi:MAG: hypothetical protein ACI4JQ_05565 [Ruminococcus sp.]